MMEAAPVWELDASAYQHTWKRIWYWLDDRIFMKEFGIVTALIFGINWIFIRRFPSFICWLYGFVTLGSIAYLLLFFKQLAVHNYYFLDLFPLLMLSWSMGLFLLKNAWPRAIHHWIFALLMLVFFNVNLNNGRLFMNKAYEPGRGVMPDMVNPSFYQSEALREYVSELGIRYEDHEVVSMPDKTPNLTLYYLNRRGYTRRKDRVSRGDMERYLDQGVDFLVISDSDMLKDPSVEPYLNKPIGVFDNSIYFFDLSK